MTFTCEIYVFPVGPVVCIVPFDTEEEVDSILLLY